MAQAKFFCRGAVRCCAVRCCAVRCCAALYCTCHSGLGPTATGCGSGRDRGGKPRRGDGSTQSACSLRFASILCLPILGSGAAADADAQQGETRLCCCFSSCCCCVDATRSLPVPSAALFHSTRNQLAKQSAVQFSAVHHTEPAMPCLGHNMHPFLLRPPLPTSGLHTVSPPQITHIHPPRRAL